MKLRVAHIDDERRMAGKFVVQRRQLGWWWDMLFDPQAKVLKTAIQPGTAHLKRASFDGLNEAMRYAKAFKSRRKLIIREIWRV